MARVGVSEFYVHGMKEPKRQYAVYGGLIPPATMEVNGNRYIMPGWYKLRDDEPTPNIKDIAFYPYKPKEPELPKIENKVWKVLSSKGDKHYEVKMDATGSLSCTCKGYGFRRTCRHIEQIKKEILRTV